MQCALRQIHIDSRIKLQEHKKEWFYLKVISFLIKITTKGERHKLGKMCYYCVKPVWHACSGKLVTKQMYNYVLQKEIPVHIKCNLTHC